MQENIAEQVVNAFGGLTKAARACGVPISTVHSWRNKKHIPNWRRAPIIEAAKREGVKLPTEFTEQHSGA